ADDGRPFVQVLADEGIIAGIKVDRGTKQLAGAPAEQVTEGLDGLRERLADYKKLGARFAKWRAVIVIGDDGRTPTRLALEANAVALARYAALCQEAEIVPIVEPEVLMDGGHSIERCFEVTEATLHTVFHALWEHKVALEGMLLKPNMVLPGAAAARQAPVAARAWGRTRGSSGGVHGERRGARDPRRGRAGARHQCRHRSGHDRGAQSRSHGLRVPRWLPVADEEGHDPRRGARDRLALTDSL